MKFMITQDTMGKTLTIGFTKLLEEVPDSTVFNYDDDSSLEILFSNTNVILTYTRNFRPVTYVNMQVGPINFVYDLPYGESGTISRKQFENRPKNLHYNARAEKMANKTNEYLTKIGFFKDHKSGKVYCADCNNGAIELFKKE